MKFLNVESKNLYIQDTFWDPSYNTGHLLNQDTYYWSFITGPESRGSTVVVVVVVVTSINQECNSLVCQS